MADQKISQLSSGTNAQAGDLFVIARGASNFNLTTAQLFNAPSAAATFSTIAGTLSTAAQPNVTSVGTLTSLAVANNLTVDTNTLFVDAVNNVVSAGNATPRQTNFLSRGQLQVESASFAGLQVFANSSTADGAYLYLVKSRAGVIGGTTVVQNNDVLGAIAFAGYDGSADRQGAAISALVNGSPGASDMPGCLVFSTTPDGSASPVERLRLDASGNLGLGVTPSAWSVRTLQFAGLVGVGQLGFSFNAFWDGAWKYIDNAAASLYQNSSGTHAWYNAASGTAGNAISFTQAMTLDASSRLLVDTTSAGLSNNTNTKLTVGGANATTFQSIKSSGGEEIIIGTTAGTTFIGTFSNNSFEFRTNNTIRARITAAGNFVAGASAALATTATDGFLYVPTCAGTPTGTPTAITGMAPIVVDTTNHKLYFYSGGVWRDAGP